MRASGAFYRVFPALPTARNGRRPDDYCTGRWVCLCCVRDWHEPPFLPFGLPVHRRLHYRDHPTHRIVFWCLDHGQAEEEDLMSRWDPALYPRPDPLVAALEDDYARDADVLQAAIDHREREKGRLDREILILAEACERVRTAQEQAG